MNEDTHNERPRAIGFVGLGDQGLPMAIAIAEAGHTLNVWARNPSSYHGLEGVPYTRHDSVNKLAGVSEIVMLCVRSDEDVVQLLDSGLLNHMRKGAVLVNHGTGIPKKANQIAQLCRAANVHALDAPVSGGSLAAVERRLTVLVGGPESVARHCEPVFRSFARHIQYMGETGAGQYAKLFNNALLIMNFASIADTLDLASQCGLNASKTVEGLKLGSAFSNALTYLNTMITGDTVDHLSQVLEEDADLFLAAMADAGADGIAFHKRALAAVRALPKLIQKLNS